MYLIADGLRIIAGCGNEEIQRLHTSVAGAFRHNIKAVSYTHLDVYKRQVLVAFGVRNSGGDVAFQQGIIRRVFQDKVGFYFGKKLVHHLSLIHI